MKLFNMTTKSKNLKISITGDLGSGKSTIAKFLSKDLGVKFFSTGEIQRKIASKYGMTTLELNEYTEKHPEIDDQIDNFIRNLGIQEESFVIDSRMAWHFLPISFKIYLEIDLDIAAKRIFEDQVRKSEKYSNIVNAKIEISARKKMENDRFEDLYGVDCSDLNNYDIIIDTSFMTPQEIRNFINEQLEFWRKHIPLNKQWLSPRRLYPSQSIVATFRENSQKIDGLHISEPVLIIRADNNYFIFDGHKRVSAAILEGSKLIPTILIAKNNQEVIPSLTVIEFIKYEVKLSWIYDWEESHSFRFTGYPSV